MVLAELRDQDRLLLRTHGVLAVVQGKAVRQGQRPVRLGTSLQARDGHQEDSHSMEGARHVCLSSIGISYKEQQARALAIGE